MMRRWDPSSSNPEQYMRSAGRKAVPDRILDHAAADRAWDYRFSCPLLTPNSTCAQRGGKQCQTASSTTPLQTVHGIAAFLVLF